MPRKTQKVNPGITRYGLKSNYNPETLEEALSKKRSGAISRLLFGDPFLQIEN